MTAPLGLWLACTGAALALLIVMVRRYARWHRLEWSPREAAFIRDATLASVALMVSGAAMAAGGW